MKPHFLSLEEKIQSACFVWHWNTFPQERGLLHANNNNSENEISGNRNKAMGVVAGVSDMEYFKNGRTTFIEFKRPGEVQSPKQRLFQEKVEAEGGRYEVVTSEEQFKALINELQNAAPHVHA